MTLKENIIYYTEGLATLVGRQGTIMEFKDLYYTCFGSEPDDQLVAAYLRLAHPGSTVEEDDYDLEDWEDDD